jgi:type II secretory pathway pseudopilin PulG
MGGEGKIKSTLQAIRASARRVTDGRSNKPSCDVLRGRRGSALIWALMISVVLLILIGIMASVAQTSFFGQKVSQVKTQAYYTAQTVNERIANWLNGQEDDYDPTGATEQQKFIQKLKTTDEPIKSTTTVAGIEADGAGNGGIADIEVSINKDVGPDGAPANTIITIKVTGRFAGDVATVVSTLRTNLDASYLYQNTSFKDPPEGAFPEEALKVYAATESALNAREHSNEIGNNVSEPNKLAVVGDENPFSDEDYFSGDTLEDYNNNSADEMTASGLGDDQELTFMNYYEENYAPTNFNNVSTVLGTTRYSSIGAINTGGSFGKEWEDIRQFVTPPSGRWLINPLLTGGNYFMPSFPESDQGPFKHANNPDAPNNTRLIMLSMGDPEEWDIARDDKDLEIRLGGIAGNVGATSYPYNDAAYYNSLIGLDFTNYKKDKDDPEGGPASLENSYVEYYKNNTFTNDADKTKQWYPQDWGSMTIYTQHIGDSTVSDEETTEGKGVDARLVFGPFAHKYFTPGDPLVNVDSPSIDNRNFGQYIGNEKYGQQPGQFVAAFPYNTTYVNPDSEGNANARKGMAFIPEYYGEDFRMFFLDNIDKNVLLLQGVNILGKQEAPSVLYSRRGVEIGGAFLDIKGLSDGYQGYKTTLNVNSTVPGMGWANIPSYFEVTTRYSQLLYDTDIVLLAPTGSAVETRESIIRDADRPQDVTINPSNNEIFRNENYKYSPTVKIIGGRIYVGENHTLDIEGGRKNTDHEDKPTLTVSPTSITVASGGALNLSPSGIFNVTTDIFVSGKMTMQPGAKAKGNIIVNEEGVVTIGGVSSGNLAAEYTGTLFVTSGGSLTIGEYAKTIGNIYVSAGGRLNIEKNCTITGDVFCAGTLDVTRVGAGNSFTLNYNKDPAYQDLIGPADNPATKSINESVEENHSGDKYVYHGIFLYDNPTRGTATLDTGSSSSLPTIGGTSGRVHSFTSENGYNDGVGGSEGVFFCYSNHHDTTDGTGTHICQHWEHEVKSWVKQNDSKSIAE